ncbi:S26 family signal peptidase [Paenirhodobacter populi]|uniref:Signal peptidase I n=1 Tax=Paenirhodobacter populi TaxID=2306993 RepID=A0A443JR26_9RHOB|nr:S26 family signal peptidase [Sinirhodobacter populi]RWR22954.1 signal peptidase I [Sinirhodobacter populi]
MTLRTLLRRSFIVGGSVFVVFGFWALHNFRLNINASESLPDHAYLMWAWPKVVWRGAVIAAVPPAAYAQSFEGYYFTKQVVGLPGDRIAHRDGAVCVAGECFSPALRDGRPFAEPLAEGVIPEGMYAAFGSAPNSLDSRYATVGLFSANDIVAVGFGTNLIPHWKEIKAWADARVE